MKKYFILIIFTLLFFSSESYSQWYVQYQNTSGNYDVRCLNRNTVWACGGGFIIKTIDGGKNWTRYNFPYTIMQVHPVNDSVVYACGYYVILKTTNAGNKWTYLWSGVIDDAIFYGLWFNNEETGWFGGDRVAMRTTNGGETFIDSMYIDSELHDIHFKDDSVGNAATFSRMFGTTNAGINWYPVTLPSSLATPFTERVTFVGDTGWAVSYGKTVFKTTNYGISWDSITNIPLGSQHLAFSIEFPSSLTGYCGGSFGKIFKTTDGGFNWFISLNIFANSINSISSFNDSIVWATRSGILHTTNGGGLIVSQNENSFLVDNHYELFQNYPNPFNSSTVIKFKIVDDSYVSLKIYDLLGREVVEFFKGRLKPGEYKEVFDGRDLNSGVYFYSLELLNEVDNNIVY